MGVSARFAEGDIKGAVRLLASFERVAPQNDATLEALRQKHPPSPDDLDLPAPSNDENPHTIASVEDMRKAISSFGKGSAGGPEGLRLSHLKALTSRDAAEAGVQILASLTEFVNTLSGHAYLQGCSAVAMTDISAKIKFQHFGP